MSPSTTTTTTLSSDYLESTDSLGISFDTSTTTEAAPPLSASPTLMNMLMSRLYRNHPEISFLVPSEFENQHIDMMQFAHLLERVGATATDKPSRGGHEFNLMVDSMGQTYVTHDQIKHSAVLNLSDVKNNDLTGLERFFAGTDMHSVINYLWVGVVTSLIVLTVIFVLFSCHFYRKFREWKKCNKDIRAHFNNDMYPDSSMPCNAADNPEAAYYQVESPPCYTIATGLPTYDEALHHNQQNFAFGMKFIYPTLAAVHHQASNLISSWEKYDITSKDEKAVKASAITKCKSSQAHHNSKSSQATSLSSSASLSSSTMLEASTATSPSSALLLPPPTYEMAASMALLSEQVTMCDDVGIATMPQLDTYALAKTSSSSDLTDIITV